ncbi:gamma-glutamyl-gamma-aminobutyrate hydrolase family protein [Flammeovirga yaeyamensis]|uniref:Gamma-glutamyl-gamma-aminobutyrate hydrolase family protein n=1 Tax=Flammeovirga yaeyamensis TaxID=367791 RepID=A0AAX1N0S5_9BACT|nr:aminodeoxychorismate/anthranilate synthase component II [Flammeovirga yaeyamensis]MBB3698678.1 anthranilate synthase component 2 [Flammeovirga yaeyamensis]NMF33977.1 aminodeoxychorismate/anthranilate synthase component II [Flammeovirga yaeyamensis]QWG00966.1 gamma-glutamyl-gamma-aminobutyrate hydrolase family protein [Flammeovirga yaeyamensis]
MILLLDNFDSFTYNLVDYFTQLGKKVEVVRNDTPLDEITPYKYEAVVLSPGPETPDKAGNMMEVIKHYHKTHPILGICLGHQAIGEFFGGQVHKALKPMHGKMSRISCDTSTVVFDRIPEELTVVRYHSLILDHLPEEVEVIAQSQQNEVMAIQHKHLPIYGVQFHPEAILTEFGLDILKNWISSW